MLNRLAAVLCAVLVVSPVKADTPFTTFAFPSSASGATSRTTPDRITDICNVKDFGAIADWNGVTGTDNTPFFQAAVNACANGGRVVAPHGKYRWASRLIFPAANVGIIFQGSGGTDQPKGTYIFANFDGYMLDTSDNIHITGNVTQSSNSITSVSSCIGINAGDYITGFGIPSSNSPITVSSCSAGTLIFSSTAYASLIGAQITVGPSNTGSVAVIEGFTFQQASVTGSILNLGNGPTQTVRNNAFFIAGGGIAINVPQAFSPAIEDNVFSGPGVVGSIGINIISASGGPGIRNANAQAFERGILMTSSVQGASIISSRFETNKTAIESYANGVMIAANQYESNITGIIVSGSSTTVASNWMTGHAGWNYANNTAQSFPQSGIFVIGGTGITIASNSIGVVTVNAGIDISSVVGQNIVVSGNNAQEAGNTSFIGTLSGNTLTVASIAASTSITAPYHAQDPSDPTTVTGLGMTISGAGVTTATILQQLTGSRGGNGTYTFSGAPQTIGPIAMTGTWPGSAWKVPTTYVNPNSDVSFKGNNNPYTGVAFAQLPVAGSGGAGNSLNQGDTYEVSDAATGNCSDSACNWGANVTGGGGSFRRTLRWNGTNWTILGK